MAEIQLTDANFEAEVLKSTVPVLVDFWAPWCGPCQAMAPIFQQVAQQLGSRYRFAKVDTEAHPALAQQFAIRSIPTLAVFKSGREIARQAGAMQAAQLQQWLARLQVFDPRLPHQKKDFNKLTLCGLCAGSILFVAIVQWQSASLPSWMLRVQVPFATPSAIVAQ